MSSSDMTPAIVNSYGATWGPSLTATFLAAVYVTLLSLSNLFRGLTLQIRRIYGITVLQTYYYYNHHAGDRLSWRLLVGAILFVSDLLLRR